MKENTPLPPPSPVVIEPFSEIPESLRGRPRTRLEVFGPRGGLPFDRLSPGLSFRIPINMFGHMTRQKLQQYVKDWKAKKKIPDMPVRSVIEDGVKYFRVYHP